MLSTLAELRGNIEFTTRETQISSRIDEFINLTINEINDFHLWSFLRRKTTFDTTPAYSTGTVDTILASATVIAFTDSTFQTDGIVAGRRIKIHDDTLYRTILSVDSETQLTLVTAEAYGGTADATGGLSYSIQAFEDYQLPRDVDKLGLVRQTASPFKIINIPDEIFYLWIPDPTDTGNPRWYRLWEEFGVETQVASAEKLNVVSDNAADTQTVSIVGTDASGYSLIETYTLSGVASQSGSKNFRTIRQVSKSADTTGNITVVGNSSSTTFVTLLPEERSPRFKRMSFYPIPSSAITISIEYFTRLRELVNDQDVPAIDKKWHYLIREGALSKVYQYQNKENDYLATWRIYRDGLREMKKQDVLNVDFIPHLRDSNLSKKVKPGIFEISDDNYVGYF